MPKQKILRVKGPKLCAHVVFEKWYGTWHVKWMAPIIRKIVGYNPTSEMGRRLTDKGLTYEWLDPRDVDEDDLDAPNSGTTLGEF